MQELINIDERELKDLLKDLKNRHNRITQRLYRLREKISSFQTQLLALQRKRIMAANAQKIETKELEGLTGLSREEILKGIGIMQERDRLKLDEKG